ncbi:MAG: DUF4293 domain-containing protein [Bacteroidia bacterium]
MIQRIQSLYLLIAAVLAASVLAFDIWSGEVAPDANQGIEQVVILDASEMVMETTGNTEAEADMVVQNTFWIALLCGLTTILGFIAIFLYKNRKLQNTISRLCMLLLTGVLVIIFFYIDEGKAYFQNTDYESMYDVAAFLPIASIAFFFLATRAITADENLVRSSERLR